MIRAARMAALGVVVLASGCGIVLGFEDTTLGDIGNGGAGGAGGAAMVGECTATSECDDENPCTVDVCNVDRECEHVELSGDAPADDQTAGDCLRTICSGGTIQDVVDDEDLPDDGNGCTSNVCVEGVVIHEALDEGTTCDENGGSVCNGVAMAPGCVECNGPSDCDHLPQNDCQSRACNLGVCEVVYTAAGTPLNETQQAAGDCKVKQCDGSGGEVTVTDASDVPVDGNDCTDDVCTGDVPSNPNHPTDTVCGDGTLVCNGSGVCTGCTNDDQCADDTDCSDWSCGGGGDCEVAHVMAGTVLPPGSQVDGDCQNLECDGEGGTTSVPFDDPGDDNNDCTTNTCSMGQEIYDPVPIDTACGSGMVCTANGQCVDCNNPSQCPAAPACQSAACVANACGTVNDPSGSAAPLNLQTSGDCLLVVCDGQGAVAAQPQVSAADVPVDGNSCTQDVCNGSSPSNPPEASGTTCSGGNGAVCDGAGSCVECVADQQCDPPQTCIEGEFRCGVFWKQLGEECTYREECQSGNCVTGVCCEDNCVGTCITCKYALPKAGHCGFVDYGLDPHDHCAGQQTCNGAGKCGNHQQ